MIGANSDVAIEIVHKFAKKGFNFYFFSRDLSECRINASDISLRYDCKVLSARMDLSIPNEVISASQITKENLEGIIVASGQLEDQIDAQKDYVLFYKMLAANFSGIVVAVERMIPILERNKKGFVVIIGSAAGDRGRKKNYLYGSTKAGLHAYTQGLRHRVSDQGINVLLVKPGFVQTKMTQSFDLPKYLTQTPERLADRIFKAVMAKRHQTYGSFFWFFLMTIIKMLPNSVMHKMKF